MVGPDIGLQRAAAVELGFVAGEAELVFAERGDMRTERVFEADQPSAALGLIVESMG